MSPQRVKDKCKWFTSGYWTFSQLVHTSLLFSQACFVVCALTPVCVSLSGDHEWCDRSRACFRDAGSYSIHWNSTMPPPPAAGGVQVRTWINSRFNAANDLQLQLSWCAFVLNNMLIYVYQDYTVLNISWLMEAVPLIACVTHWREEARHCTDLCAERFVCFCVHVVC